jgi:hypothetical protein
LALVERARFPFLVIKRLMALLLCLTALLLLVVVEQEVGKAPTVEAAGLVEVVVAQTL